MVFGRGYEYDLGEKMLQVRRRDQSDLAVVGCYLYGGQSSPPIGRVFSLPTLVVTNPGINRKCRDRRAGWVARFLGVGCVSAVDWGMRVKRLLLVHLAICMDPRIHNNAIFQSIKIKKEISSEIAAECLLRRGEIVVVTSFRRPPGTGTGGRQSALRQVRSGIACPSCNAGFVAKPDKQYKYSRHTK